MAKYGDEFFRCPNCKYPYFKFDEIYLIAKDVGLDYPTAQSRVLNKKTVLVCADCGKKYTREELLNNE